MEEPRKSRGRKKATLNIVIDPQLKVDAQIYCIRHHINLAVLVDLGLREFLRKQEANKK